MGCAWDTLNPFQSSSSKPPPPGPKDSAVIRPVGLETAQASTAETNPDMLEAMELFRQEKYDQAGKKFHRLAEKTKDDSFLAEKARFYEAESLYQQRKYPKAADTYVRMLNDFGAGTYRNQALQRMFDIANYWLEDTRQEMRQTREVREGKRWIVWPHFVHWEETKPLLDEEGRAVELLEKVRYHDITGPLADRALFLMGSVKYFNEDFREADFCFSQLVEMHPKSPYAADATELAITSKHRCTGGADYDGRKVAEARALVHKAQLSYPQLDQERLRRQLANITFQQAEKDYKTAEFYRRTGKPCPAFFMYEVVRRRYPGTKFADLATEHMHQLRAQVEKENGGKIPVPEATPLPPDSPLLQPGTPLFGDPGSGVTTPPRPLPNLER
jgi:TolA-binding protein